MSNPPEKNAIQNTYTHNSRWWESYLVRYLPGAIFGGFCVAVLAYNIAKILGVTNLNAKITQNLGWQTLFAGLIIGLFYAYISSSPITLIHYGRFGKSTIETKTRYFWVSWSISLVAIQVLPTKILTNPSLCVITGGLAASALIIFYMAECKTTKTNRPIIIKELALWIIIIISICAAVSSADTKTSTLTRSLTALSLPAIWVGFVQYFTLWRVLKNENEITNEYWKLSQARQKPAHQDIKETYQHLREHSNSIFIFVLEGSLTSLLLLIIIFCKNSSDALTMIFSASTALAGAWLVPTIFMWSRANSIESFIKNKEEQ